MKAPLQIIRVLLLVSGLMLAFPSAYGAAVCSSSPSNSASDTLTDSGGSGSNYSNNEFCDFLIQPTNATTITLTFSAFNLESGFDFLTVYDGSTSGSPVLANNLSGTSLPASVTSTGGAMLVRFTSDSSVTRSGFISSWTSASTPANSAICNSSNSTSSSGTLTDSGGTSGNYSDNENCQFLIQPTGGGNITLSFSAFNYENNFDFVRVYDGTTTSSTLLGTFTNTSIPTDVVATSGSMLVVSTSDGSITRSGFQATWSTSTGSSCPAQTVGDSFPSVSYSQNNGSQNWTGNWTEIGESDGTSAGIARVRSDLCTSGNCLRLGVPSGNSAQTYSNHGVFREADLNTSTSATLSFVYRSGVNQGSQTIVLAASNDGGNSWTNLQSFFMNSTNTSPTSVSFDISAYTSSNTQIRFLASGNNAVIGMYIDDISINYQPTCTPSPVIDGHFDELSWNGTTGEIADSSGNSNDGVATGASTDANGLLCHTGVFTTNQYAVLPHATDFLLNDGTVSLWFKDTDNAEQTGLFSKDARNFLTGGHLSIFTTANRSIQARIQSTTQSYTIESSPGSYSLGQWVHVAVNFGADGFHLYLDGVLADSNSYVGGLGSSSGGTGNLEPIVIGANSWASSEQSATPVQDFFTGSIDEVQIYNDSLSAAEIVQARNNFLAGNNFDGSARTCPAPALDHFAISHSTTAISCLAENITISAHTNASPGHTIETGYTGTISLSTSTSHGDWSWVSGGLASNLTNSGNGIAIFVFDGSENGTVILGLSNTFDELVNINVNDGGVTETSGVALATEDQNLDFDVAGFRFVESITENSIGLQIAGKQSNVGYGSQNLVLQAINTNPVTGACEAALTGTETVQVRLECTNPASCLRPLFLGATSTSNTITTTNSGVSLNFGNASDNDADFVMNYPDAGAIQLHAEHTLPNGTIMRGSSNDIIWRPFGFDLIASPNPAAPDHTGGVLTAAGSPFTVTATAVLWDSNDDSNNDGIPDNHDDSDPSTRDDLSNNTVTLGGNNYNSAPSFGQENEDIILAAELNQPSGGSNPALSGSGISSFTNGAGSNLSVIYHEVGIIELNASISDNDYLGIGSTETQKMLSKSGYVGRFRPASFDVAVTNVGMLENTCTTGTIPFTYIGQDFGYLDAPSFSVTARNVNLATTTNYRGLFVKLDGSSATVSSVTTDTSNQGSDLALLDVNFTAAGAMSATPDNLGVVNYVFGADRYRYGPDPVLLAYSKEPNSEVTPFTADIDRTITLIDDGDTSTVVSQAIDITGNEQRFGRLKMNNVHGSELSNLQMPMVVEYLSASGFTVNTDDNNCTQIVDSDLTVTPNLRSPGASTVSVTNPNSILGDHEVTLTAPGSGLDGNVIVTPNLDTSLDKWLRYDWDSDGDLDDDPSATATFGIYKGNPVNIYIQQTYQ